MTVTDLDRKAAKISTLSSNNLDRYEYLTDEDLRLKTSTVEQAKFKYSPLGKIFNKGLDKDDQKEGLFKRLENIKDNNEEHLKLLKDQLEKQPSTIKVKNPNFNNVFFKNLLDDKSMKVFDEIRKQNEIIDIYNLILLAHLKSMILKLEIL